VGIGNFGEAFPLYRLNNSLDPPGMRRAAHNMFIQIAGETGPIGLLILLLLIVVTLKSLKITSMNTRQSKNVTQEIELYSKATSTALIGFLVCGFFLSQAYSWFFYYLVGLSVVLSDLKKKYEK
jgi:O-antigen ligase